MKVFVLYKEKDYEGKDVVGVFDNEDVVKEKMKEILSNEDEMFTYDGVDYFEYEVNK